MSIWYCEINKTDTNNRIIDWTFIEKFKDEVELAKWFAYDYNEKAEIYDYYSCNTRFVNCLANQRLCKDDSYGEFGYHIEEGMYINGVMASYIQRYRNRVIYDSVYDRFLDIRNYRKLIKHHLNDSIRNTAWDSIYIRKRWYRFHRQGRTHYKSGNYKHIFLGKQYLKHSDNRFEKFEINDYLNDNVYNICCDIPKTIRSKRRMTKLGWALDYFSHTENNWKEVCK